MALVASSVVVAVAVAVAMAGCHGGSPTEPGRGQGPADTFVLHATMSNTAGTPTMIEAALNVDNQTVGDSCPPADEIPQYDADNNLTQYLCEAPALASYTFNAGGRIAPGSHRLLFFVSTAPTGRPVTYTVAAFSLTIYDESGKPIKTLPFPAQTATLPLGDAMTYNFSF